MVECGPVPGLGVGLVLGNGEVVGQVVADDAVALAGVFFEAWAVEDRDFPSTVLDEVVGFEGFCGYADGGAVGAEHIGEVLVGELEGGGFGSVGAEEEPACEALGDVVVCVASGGLGGLDELGLDVSEDEVVESSEVRELADGVVGGAGEAVACHLHIDLVEAAMGADEG